MDIVKNTICEFSTCEGTVIFILFHPALGFVCVRGCDLQDLRYRGTDGPLHVRQSPADHPLHQAFLKAGEQHPIGTTPDMNGEKQEGLAIMDQTIKDGMRYIVVALPYCRYEFVLQFRFNFLYCRWSAARAYLHPVKNRPNIYTSSGITCTKVLIQNKKAVGIEFIRYC